MNFSRPSEILSYYQLRHTSCRQQVLELLLNADYAITQRDLEERSPNFDRVTLYRTLNTFIDKGLLHKIPNESGIARYALSAPYNKKEKEHIHFKCESCGRTECMIDYSIPSVKVPDGYTVDSVNLIVSGQCKECNE